MHIQQHEQAHMFFTGTLNKQLRYVDNEPDHPYLEQTYTHLALLYKTLKNYNSSIYMWEQLMKVHMKTYGDREYYLASDYKNLATC